MHRSGNIKENTSLLSFYIRISSSRWTHRMKPVSPHRNETRQEYQPTNSRVTPSISAPSPVISRAGYPISAMTNPNISEELSAS